MRRREVTTSPRQRVRAMLPILGRGSERSLNESETDGSETQHEGRTTLQGPHVAHPAAHAEHQLPHDRQSYAIPTLAGAEKGQEYLPLQSSRHSGAIVAHQYLQAPAAALTRLHP